MSAPQTVMKNGKMADYDIDILLEDDRWDVLADFPKLARSALDAAIHAAQNKAPLMPFSEISLALVSDAKISTLNQEYRGLDKPTNVLSFPAIPPGDNGQAPAMLGDIVLAFETITAQAKAGALLLSDHVSHLLIHGFYHLQNFNHETEAEADVMEALEVCALDKLGIANPYDKDTQL